MPQPASALSPQSDPINSKTASVVHPREWMPCPSCPLCSRAPKTRHFTSYKHTTDHALLTVLQACACRDLIATPYSCQPDQNHRRNPPHIHTRPLTLNPQP